MQVVGLIPARGGSKGIPRKNLAPVAGRPLIAWTIEAAKASRTLTRVVVSTDDDEIAATAETLGAETLRRPAAIAADETPMLDVVLHAAAELRPDVLVLLQPTSPLRRAEHVDAAVDLLVSAGASSVVSVVAVPHRFDPAALMTLDGGRLAMAGPAPSRRQDQPVLYARNGPAVLVLRPERVRDHLYPDECLPYVMDEESSLDVDTAFDLRLAGLLLA